MDNATLTTLAIIIIAIIILILITCDSKKGSEHLTQNIGEDRYTKVDQNAGIDVRNYQTRISKNNQSSTNDFMKNSVAIGGKRFLRKINGNLFRKNLHKNFWEPIGIANDGDLMKLSNLKYSGAEKNQLITGILYGSNNSPNYVLKFIPDATKLESMKCLPQSFGGIDPKPNVQKTCYLINAKFR
jgi:hypothetical protein